MSARILAKLLVLAVLLFLVLTFSPGHVDFVYTGF
jgi:hypothetical protein